MPKLKIGLIADGNRRWAKEKGLQTKEGHYQGFKAVKDVVFEYLYNHNDKFDTLVVYTFSTENWNRSPMEIKNLMNLFEEVCDTWGHELIEKETRFIQAGRKTRLPKSLMKKITDLEEKTKKFKKFTVILCMDYGSHDEIKRAVKKGGTNFEKYLEVPPLDLIVRTSGEQRLSNFCLWQAAYSEFIFYKKHLPALTEKDMQKIEEEFDSRNVRKGK
ncbi:MAG: di-trans,poly-cis-decaprenylcistransferase [Candidatus Magasanikbacteria bacterium CG_4_10_14_0_2_um_filter_33_14]|uniref:Isoprenyl transferase n=1 Tax=Candidatus Magasanikbacteria bacterium CG_4_10_14_0_2_um_filter_33_14 TaxID=1974636 RepID=A0A2M7VC29_9BACT|nr:MAG: di-trans,poly-cis-decaprenylcistransferase [Candidatus Magasanikbacteria bacterium CG_4_10_14_0_2_um_filter_33_14]